MFLKSLFPLLVLAATGCGGAKDAVADQVEEGAERRADQMEAGSREAGNGVRENAVAQQAKTVRQAGEERAEAIRESDLNAGRLSPEEKAKLVRGE